MPRLPSRKELAARVDQLERELAIFAAGTGAGAVLRGSPTARAAALSGAARLTPAALAADLLIRQEESLAARGVQAAMPLVETAVLDPLEPALRDLATLGSLKRTRAPAPKKPSKFNKAVSAGVKALKASTSYGPKGTINNAQAAFSTSTKAASNVMKGKKTPKKAGPVKTAMTAAKKVLGKISGLGRGFRR